MQDWVLETITEADQRWSTDLPDADEATDSVPRRRTSEAQQALSVRAANQSAILSEFPHVFHFTSS
jgi:hypothetical protein